jgi:LemA protein
MKGRRNVGLLVIGAIVVILLLWGCGGYNGLVSADQNVKKVWGNVETNYQRRTDLYSSVIKTVEASANFEKSTLNAVVEARAKATAINVDINDQASMDRYQQAQGQLQSSFGRLLAVAENYPDLKTTKAFQDFQTQIEGTENRINVARQDYNGAVNGYNLKVKRFPNNLLAGVFSFHEKAFYKAEPGSEKNPDIKFDIK